MQYVGTLAPIAFVFALAALAQIGTLKRQVESLEQELTDLKQHVQDDRQ